MIRVVLPHHLRKLAQVGDEVSLEVDKPPSLQLVLETLEQRYPVLTGTMRDAASGKRRPFVRFFACGKDLSHDPPANLLPDAVAQGEEPFFVVGAMAGG